MKKIALAIAMLLLMAGNTLAMHRHPAPYSTHIHQSGGVVLVPGGTTGL